MYPRYSPDGTKIAVNIIEDETDIWIVNVETGALSKLTSGGSNENPLWWTPDGEHVTFISRGGAGERFDIYGQPAYRSGSAELLFTPFEETDGGRFIPGQWSPDGRTLVGQGVRGPGEKGMAILYLTVGESPGLRELVPSSPGTGKFAPAFSPDGKWVAYASNEPGGHEVYVTPFPGPGERRVISIGGGDTPLWSPNGKRIYYRTRSGDRIMVVDIVTEPEFDASQPQVVFGSADYKSGFVYFFPNFDLHPDGESFLMIRQVEEHPPPTHLNVIINWFEDLKRLVPTGQ